MKADVKKGKDPAIHVKKLTLHSEAVYVLAILTLSFAVAMVSAADFGVSMIVAPAYILSLAVDALTFGQSEYILQAALFVVFCIAMRKFSPVYLTSFVTCLIYGAVLDMWRAVIPAFNPEITAPGAFPMYIRVIFFVLGMLLTAFSVALFFKTYLYPQVYDFFVKGVSSKYGFNITKFKRIFDACCLTAAAAMTLLIFRGFRGIGVGTLVMTAFNGVIIGWFSKLFDKCLNIVPALPSVAKKFELN